MKGLVSEWIGGWIKLMGGLVISSGGWIKLTGGRVDGLS